MRVLISIILLLFLGACQNQPQEVELYFDLEQVVESVIGQMEGREYRLVKLARMDDVSDTAELRLDSTQWGRELELFSSANINQPQYQGVYRVTDGNDPNSNLKIRRFEHEAPNKASIPWVEVYYLDRIEKYKFVALNYREKNAGFSVNRNLSMSFEDIRGENLLKEYTVEGYQKIFGQDTVQFFIHGELSY